MEARHPIYGLVKVLGPAGRAPFVRVKLLSREGPFGKKELAVSQNVLHKV